MLYKLGGKLQQIKTSYQTVILVTICQDEDKLQQADDEQKLEK